MPGSIVSAFKGVKSSHESAAYDDFLSDQAEPVKKKLRAIGMNDAAMKTVFDAALFSRFAETEMIGL